MGSGIAQISAAKGIDVLLSDQSEAAASSATHTIGQAFDKKVKRKSLLPFEKDVIVSHLRPVMLTDATNWSHADCVVEAVFEDLTVKHQVFQAIEKLVPEHCLLATNTSALSVADIAAGTSRPEKVIGLHYFSPVPAMPLLEIIPHATTSTETLSAAMALGLKQGKTVIVVKDVAGFYVNRCLGPYLAETLALVQAGVDPVLLDKLMTDFGFPVGPISLADEVGIDVAAHVNTSLSSALGVRMLGGDPTLFHDMISAGFLGKKSGAGFFIHPKTSKKGAVKAVNPAALELLQTYRPSAPVTIENADVINRLLVRFVNEAILCVQDEIVASPTEGDMGAVFGMGFPPYLGGPFRYADAIGSTKLNAMMLAYSEVEGEQFTPCDLLQEMAKTNKTFY